jgi:hypothetical protein
MRYPIFLLILIFPIILNAQFEGSFGINIEETDSLIIKKVKKLIL